MNRAASSKPSLSRHDLAFAKSLVFFMSKKVRGLGTQQEVAQKIGKTQALISKITRLVGICSENNRRKLAALWGYDLDDFIAVGQNILDGHDPDYQPRPALAEESNLIEIRHYRVIVRFVDKPRALRINEKLLELETLCPHAMEAVESIIESLLKGNRPQKRHAARTKPAK
jgi:hypothetical protein